MVDHWPVSTVLSEVEQHIIKEHREGKLMYLSDAEKEMVSALRQEQEIIVNEQNEKSANQRAVEDLDKLNTYMKEVGLSGAGVEYFIKCHANQTKWLSEGMNGFNIYQNKAAETAIYPGKGTPLGLIYCALKGAGEAGEFAENVGKALRDDGLADHLDYPACTEELLSVERRYKLKLELGDELWYVSQKAKELGFTLEEIAEENLSKLASRKERGTLKGSGDER